MDTKCICGSKHKHGPLLGAGAILGALSFPEYSVPLAEWHWPETTASLYPKNFFLAWDSRDNEEAEQPVCCLRNPEVVIDDRQGIFRTSILVLHLG